MKVTAYINHGRWLADCPQCNGAELVKVGQPFVCRGLVGSGGFHGETNVCGFSADVEFPKDKFIIEGILIPRRTENRNWRSGETVEFLRDENTKHGLK